MINKIEWIKSIQERNAVIQENIINIQTQLEYGMINTVEATEQVAKMKKQERKLIKEAVDAIHLLHQYA